MLRSWNCCDEKKNGRHLPQIWKPYTLIFIMRLSNIPETLCVDPAAASIMILVISTSFMSLSIRFAHSVWILGLSLSIFHRGLRTSMTSTSWLTPSESYRYWANRVLSASASRVKRVSKTMFDLQNRWRISAGLDPSPLSCRAWRGSKSFWLLAHISTARLCLSESKLALRFEGTCNSAPTRYNPTSRHTSTSTICVTRYCLSRMGWKACSQCRFTIWPFLRANSKSVWCSAVADST